MKLRRAWILLLGAVLIGCAGKPAPVPEEPRHSPTEPEVGRDAAIAEIERLGSRLTFDEESSDRAMAVGCGGRQDVTGTDWRTILRDEEVLSRQGLTDIRDLCGMVMQGDSYDGGHIFVSWTDKRGVTAAKLKRLHGQPSRIMGHDEQQFVIYYYGEIGFSFTKKELGGVQIETRELGEEVVKVVEAILTETDSE